MKGLSKKLAGIAGAAIVATGGMQDSQAGMSVLPSIDLSDYAALQVNEEKSDVLYDMGEKAESYILDQLLQEGRSDDDVQQYAKNHVTDLLQKGDVNAWQQNKQLSMACLIVTVRDLHYALTQKMTEEQWHEKYGADLRLLSAIRQNKSSYNVSPYIGKPIIRSVKNPQKTVLDIKQKMALDFVIDEIKFEKNKPIIQSIQAYAKVMKALHDNKLDGAVLTEARAMETAAQESLKSIDEKYLSGVNTELAKTRLLYGELSEDFQVRKAVKDLYIERGLKKVDQFVNDYYHKNGIEAPQRPTEEATPMKAAQEIQNPPKYIGTGFRGSYMMNIPGGR